MNANYALPHMIHYIQLCSQINFKELFSEHLVLFHNASLCNPERSKVISMSSNHMIVIFSLWPCHCYGASITVFAMNEFECTLERLFEVRKWKKHGDSCSTKVFFSSFWSLKAFVSCTINLCDHHLTGHKVHLSVTK